MKRSRLRKAICAVTLALIIAAALALAACGGSETTASSSPSAATSQAAASPSAASGATPLPAPTVAGTIAFLKLEEVADDANGDIWVVNTDGTGLKRLTDDPLLEDHPAWSPDGSKIAYTHWPSISPEKSTIWVMNADGSGEKQLTKGAVHGVWPEWSPDGKQIAFWRETPSGESIYVMNADGSGVKAVAGGILVWEESPQGPEYGGGMGWTPDGKILYLSDGEVVAVYPDGSGREQLTQGADLGTFAMSPDGSQFALENSARRLYVAPVQGSGAPVTLLDPVYDFMADPWTVPTWCPDATALAISSSSLFGMTGSPIYVINADGTGLSQVPGIENADDAAWRPQ